MSTPTRRDILRSAIVVAATALAPVAALPAVRAASRRETALEICRIFEVSTADIQKAVGAGWISVNDARRLLGLDDFNAASHD